MTLFSPDRVISAAKAREAVKDRHADDPSWGLHLQSFVAPSCVDPVWRKGDRHSMLPTRPAGWSSLQALRSHLAGRLVRFKRNTNTAGSVLRQAQNDAAFFEADLRYIFTIIPTVADIPGDEYDELNQTSHDLLTALDGMINRGFLNAFEALRTEGSRAESHDTILPDLYPRLRSLLALLETFTNQFNLITGQDAPLFVLPEGQSRNVALNSLAHVKAVLGRFANGAQKQNYPQLSQLPPSIFSAVESSQDQHGIPPKHASLVVNALFRDMRQRNCGKPHEIKLKVPDGCQTGFQETTLDMFLSGCLNQEGWHRTTCGTSQAVISDRRKDGICAAIQRAKAQGRAIYLSVDRQGLFDISDTMPAMLSASTQLTSETLEELLNQKALTRITPSDYEAKTAVKKLSSREKSILALGLAKCLLEFFDDDMELASHSWKPESIYFLTSSRAQQQDRALYISLRPNLREAKSSQLPGAVGLGNPVLLSFAKLLLEIDTGERITKEIHSESTANLPTWVWMCGFVDEVERNGGGNYLRAVEGCLYMHVALRKARDQSDDFNVGDVIRKTIYEQIVRNLELMVNPQSSKRKRRDSVSELPLSKKLSISTPAPVTGTQRPKELPPYKATTPLTRPTSRDDFEVAVVCALPLEFDAVCAVVDEFWNEDYGKVNGDENVYTNARIGKINVVLLLLSSMGKVSAASTCANLRLSYPEVSLVLVSGICGGVPFVGDEEEILLGDVIISRHIVQYDLGRRYPDKFETRDTADDRFGRAPKSVRNLLALVETNMGREKLEALTSTYLQDIQTKATRKLRGPKYRYPGASQDRLFKPGYHHQHRASSHTSLFKAHKKSICTYIESHHASCDDIGCDKEQLISRDRVEAKRQQEEAGCTKDAQAPFIFIGTIGSGDTVMKSGEERDRIARAHNLLAFEMEGAGVWDEMPCIIIKGVCDYADSHKNKNWQYFAAATAASATKALLLSWYIQRDKMSTASVGF